MEWVWDGKMEDLGQLKYVLCAVHTFTHRPC